MPRAAVTQATLTAGTAGPAGPAGRRRARRRRGIGSVLVTLAGLVWIVSVLAVLGFSVYDGARQADAIVVLGAAQYDGRPSPVLRARIDHALALWRAGYAPVLIFTGGTGSGDTTSEAAVSASYARRRGVPDNAMLLETEGRTTAASMRSVSEMLRVRGGTTAILVSDPFHMLRLWILARRFGMQAATSPTRTSPISESVRVDAGYIFSESVKAPLAYFIE